MKCFCQLLLVVGLLACTVVGSMGTEDHSTTTLCAIAKSTSHSKSETVRVHAIYITDLKHGALVKDKRCNDVNFFVIDSEDGGIDSSVDSFNKVVAGDLDDLSVRIFSIDASGVVDVRSKESPQGTFTVAKVWEYRRLGGHDWKTAK